MKLFGDAKVLQGSLPWTGPFRIRVTRPESARPENSLPPPAIPQASLPEYDEDGRVYVFRFARTSPQQYTIERDRIFDYMKRRRLPDAGQRQIRRDLRNAANFFTDVRELQVHPEVDRLSS